MRVGVISDTHGLLRPEALAALAGVEAILHAGDIGREGIVEDLRRIAPVTAIRGNVDVGDWADIFPETVTVGMAGALIHMLHALHDLPAEGPADGTDVVVFGHSHRPLVDVRDGVLHLNPGSAGPRRFRLPVTLAHLWLGEGEPRAEVIDLL